MGFFESLLTGLAEQGAKSLESQYLQMDLHELEREWNRVYAHKRFYNDPNWNIDLDIDPKSPNGILDKVYSQRTRRPSWRERALQHKQSIIRAAQEKKKHEEEIQKEKLQNKSIAASFSEILKQSEMARIIIDKINELNIEAKYIAIFTDRVIINDNDYFLGAFVYEDGNGLEDMNRYNLLCEIKYNKYKYPRLNHVQILVLQQYIVDTVNGFYKPIPNDKYRHEDFVCCLHLEEEEETEIYESW